MAEPCGCYDERWDEGDGYWAENGIQFCPMHKAAPTLLEALELLLGCADWESEDIATLNLTQFKASMNQATTAIAQARSKEAK